jgi:D-3-phosphoglycerate dehydrogenase / 2-oxoglutarate reductase
MKVLVTTIPFGNMNSEPLDLLDENNIEYVINPLNRKLQPGELSEMVSDFDAVIAGTEEINQEVFSRGKNLRFISRVGIGVDSVNLNAAKENGVKVSYTPDAPAPAVAELTIGLMLSLARSISKSNTNFLNGKWERYFGYRLSEMNIGIVGGGRIGRRVINHLSGFSPKNIFINDINATSLSDLGDTVTVCSKEYIYEHSDVISLHVPLTSKTHNMITKAELEKMKDHAYIINTSRGGIINEEDLFNALEDGVIAGAAVDTYEQEPYFGKLSHCSNCINTAHMGSMTLDCRSNMEIEATKEVIRFLKGEPLLSEVPQSEYSAQLLFGESK